MFNWGLVGFGFGGEARWVFSRILHILGSPFRDEPFMKEAFDSRDMSRESWTWGGGESSVGEAVGRGISGG